MLLDKKELDENELDKSELRRKCTRRNVTEPMKGKGILWKERVCHEMEGYIMEGKGIL